MEFLPFRSETIVLSHEVKEVNDRLIKVIKPVKSDSEQTHHDEKTTSAYLFNGIIGKNQFTISKIIQQPENFLPLISGKIDPTSVGCIVFLKYRMFFSTNLFLGFWSVVTFLMTLLFIIGYSNYLYATICLGFGVANYSIAIANFNAQIKRSKRLLHKVLY